MVACTDDRRPPRECLRDYASPAFSPAATNAAQQPAWSPNGRRLAWWWSGIYVARADGTRAHKIARDRIGPMGSFNFSTYAPSWQPL